MKPVTMFDSQYPQLLNNHIQNYYNGESGVKGLLKEYPYLDDYKLLPLLLPVNVIFFDTKTGQAGQNTLKLKASHSLSNANVNTVLRLCLVLASDFGLRKYRHMGKCSAKFIEDCLTEFLKRVDINPKTVAAQLHKAKFMRLSPVEK